MTDEQLEGRLRDLFRFEIAGDEPAPPDLRASVVAIPKASPARRRFARRRGFTLLAAAALIGVLAGSAAIGSALAGELYDLHVLFENIEDNPDNITRFFVIGVEPARKSGDDKTAIMFTTAHKPGALAEVLDVFRDSGINLTDIEKRPSQKTNWEYYFFIDAQGHSDDAKMREAIEAAKHHCLQLTVLGSYPRATEVL